MVINMKNEISRIVDVLDLKNVKYCHFSEQRMDHKLIRSLLASNVGYFEWHPNLAMLYLTDFALPYFEDYSNSNGSFYNYLLDCFDDHDFYSFLTAFERLYKGTASEESLKLFIRSKKHSMKRNIKFMLFSETTNDEQTIYGTIQDETELENYIQEVQDSSNLLIQVIDSVPIPLIYVDSDMNLFKSNKAVEDVLNIDFDLWKNKPYEDYIRYIETAMKVKSKTIVSQDDRHRLFEISAEKEGQRFELIIDEVNVFDQSNTIIGRILIHSDITNRVIDIEKAQKLIKVNELLVRLSNLIHAKTDLQHLYKIMLEGILEVIPKANSACILMLDYDQNLYIKESIGYDESFSSHFRIPFHQSFAYDVLKGDFRKTVSICDLSNTFKDYYPDLIDSSRGTELESNITAPITVDGNLYGLISIDSASKTGFDEMDLNLIDIIRSKIEVSINRYKEISSVIESAHRDDLTNLYNRNYFNSISEAILEEAHATQEAFSLTLIDLDNLKQVNDTFGHLAGDLIIKHFADTLRHILDEPVVLSRIGGDEFIILSPHTLTPLAQNAMEQVSQMLMIKPVKYQNEPLTINFSFGIAEYPKDAKTIEALMAIADQRMYAHKAINKSQ